MTVSRRVLAAAGLLLLLAVSMAHAPATADDYTGPPPTVGVGGLNDGRGDAIAPAAQADTGRAGGFALTGADVAQLLAGGAGFVAIGMLLRRRGKREA